MPVAMIQVPFGTAVINRVAPLADPRAYQTYTMRRPLSTHWVPATCEEAGCLAWQNGWSTTVDVSTGLGRAQHDYLRRDRTRSPHMEQVTAHLVRFDYPPGTRCFRSGDHRVPLERPSVFVVRDGDWRGNPTGRRRVLGADDWTDDFRNHEDKLATARERG